MPTRENMEREGWKAIADYCSDELIKAADKMQKGDYETMTKYVERLFASKVNINEDMLNEMIKSVKQLSEASETERVAMRFPEPWEPRRLGPETLAADLKCRLKRRNLNESI